MIAVTGICGLTGRFFIPSLRAQGYHGPIRCLVRPGSNRTGLATDGVQYIVGDCTDPGSLAELIREADILVHIAGIHLAERVIEACRAGSLNRVLFVNTTGMYSRYKAYAAEYRRIDELIQKSGLAYTIIRPTMIYGNGRDRNICRLVHIVNRMPVMPVVANGKALMQPIYAPDLASVIARAALEPVSIGRTYNVAGQSPLAYREVLGQIAMALGKKRLFVNIPFGFALVMGYLGDIIRPGGLIGSERIRRLREDKAFKYDEAERDLAFTPRSFSEGIRLEVRALREEGAI